jgi:hypothetical protein
MTVPSEREPPGEVTLGLEEALELLRTLEDARDALLTTNHLTEAALVFAQIGLISLRLGFADPEGGDDAS